MTCIVTGLFDSRREVDLVVEHLVQEFGIPRERVQLHARDPAGGAETRSPQDSDLAAAPSDPGLPDDVVRAHAGGLARGGVLLAAWVDDDHLQRVLETFREYGAVSPTAHAAGMAGQPGGQEERTRVRAYFLWEQAGRPAGRDVEFWDQARQQLEGEEGGPAARAPRLFAGETGAAPLPEKGSPPEA